MTDDQTRQFKFPDIEAEPSETLAYRDRWFAYESTARSYWLQRVAMNLSYEAGDQWKELDRPALVDGVRGFALRRARGMGGTGRNNLPKPVANYISSAAEVEISSLGKRELTANVISLSRDPRHEAAAKVAKEILEHRLQEMHWPELREEAIFLFVVTGTAIIKTWWDEEYTEMTPVGSAEAVGCPQCGMSMASAKIPATQVELVTANRASIKDVPIEAPDAEDQVELTGCPKCEGQMLEPYQVGEDEYAGQDMFGRPMADLVPKGNTAMEVVSPFDVFPENAGYDVDPRKMRIYGQCTPRSMDWIEERYPLFMDKLHPEDPTVMMRQHPLLGEYGFWGRFNPMLDAGIYADYARVFELHSDKTYRFPEGRSLVVINDEVVENGPLYRTVETAHGSLSVPRVKYHTGRFKAKHRQFAGQGAIDNLISPQNRLNGMDAQAIGVMERFGTPNLLFTEGMNVEGPEWDENYGIGMFLRYTADPVAGPGAKPEVFPPYPPSLAGQIEQRSMAIQDIKQISGPQDIEIGEAPKNISTTSGLQLLGEQAERRRAARERALITMFEQAWQHTLRLIWTLRSDPDTYEVETGDGGWEAKEYTRDMIAGQTKVKVEKQAYIDKSLWQREGVREAQADQLYRLDSQAAIKKLLEYRGLPTDVNEDLNRQVDLANQAWVDFVDEAKLPTVDENIDDPQIRFQVLGTRLLSDEGQRLMEANGWTQTRKQLSGWEMDLDLMLAKEEEVLLFYGGRLGEANATQMYAEATKGYLVQKAQYEQAQDQITQGVEQTGVAPDPMTMAQPPMPPPAPIFPPAALEDKIMLIWQGRLQQAEPLAEPMQASPLETPEQAAAKVQSFMQFMAVVMAYKVMARRALQAMQAGVPGLAAPGQGGEGQEIPPGQDFNHPAAGKNPPTPEKPSPAPGVKGGKN